MSLEKTMTLARTNALEAFQSTQGVSKAIAQLAADEYFIAAVTVQGKEVL